MARPVPYNRHTSAFLKAEELRRISWARGVLALGGAAVVGRLVHLQGVKHAELRAEGERRRLVQRPLLALRGAILDRHGKPLAQTELCCHIAIDPMSVREVDAFAELLARHLGKDAGHWQAQILQAQERRLRYLRVAPQASLNTFERLRRARDEAFAHLKRSERPVITGERAPIRRYPQGSIAPQVLGLTQLVEDRERGNTIVATCGIERSYDARLSGVNGKE
ncbi:MAG: hypothetical protein ACK4UU_03000, partial [Fimbriimonadales bacterium]